MEGEFSNTFLEDWSFLILISLGLGIVIVVMFGKSQQPGSPLKEPSTTSRCKSPSCVRCHGEDDLRSKLLRRLEEHVIETYSDVYSEDISAYLSENYPRLLSTIYSQDRKDEVLSSIYKESGYEDVQTRYMAHVWMMPELSRTPFWSDTKHLTMKTLFSLFEDQKNFRIILKEYEKVSQLESAWKENSLPTGNWRTYFLMNQGAWDPEKSSQCPQTRSLLESTQSLMQGAVFGNVLFSVLRPGSVIEPHTSPCNFRLRCHLALAASTGFKLRVGKETAEWKTGTLLVFDDSFVHSVEHIKEENVGDIADRAVLIFDIWHPEITTSEQKALSHMFMT